MKRWKKKVYIGKVCVFNQIGKKSDPRAPPPAPLKINTLKPLYMPNEVFVLSAFYDK